jgi:hypothetical protein
MSLLPLTGLADPEFVTRDPQQVIEEMIAQFETLTDRTLYPAQVERLLINLTAYRESMTREAIQDAGKQNLVSLPAHLIWITSVNTLAVVVWPVVSPVHCSALILRVH